MSSYLHSEGLPKVGPTEYIIDISPYNKYRSGTVNSKSLVGKVLLGIKQKFELINAL